MLLTNGLYLVLRFFVVVDAADTNGVAAFLRQDWPLVGVAAAQWYAYHGILDQASQQQHRRQNERRSGGRFPLGPAVCRRGGAVRGAVVEPPGVRRLAAAARVGRVRGVHHVPGWQKGKPAASAPNNSNFAESSQDEDTAHKRQKRAEKRRQKWS